MPGKLSKHHTYTYTKFPFSDSAGISGNSLSYTPVWTHGTDGATATNIFNNRLEISSSTHGLTVKTAAGGYNSFNDYEAGAQGQAICSFNNYGGGSENNAFIGFYGGGNYWSFGIDDTTDHGGQGSLKFTAASTLVNGSSTDDQVLSLNPPEIGTSADNHIVADFNPNGHTENSIGKVRASRAGFCGTYDSYKCQQIWSIGEDYSPDFSVNSNKGDFGDMWGMGYFHTNSGLSYISSGAHQLIFHGGSDNIVGGISLSTGRWQFQHDGIIGLGQATNNTITVYGSDATKKNRAIIGADDTSGYINSTYGTGGSMDLRILNNGTICADFEPSEVYFHTIDSSAGNADMKYDTSDGEMTYSTSTRNIKKNILEISGSDDILKVKSVSYDYKDGSGTDIGFIAEDVAAVNPEFAKYGPDFIYDDNGKKVHKIGKWEDDGNGKMVPKEAAFDKGSGPKDRYEKHSDNQVPIDINVRALLSHAVQKIQDLEARLKVLENA